MRTRTIVKTAGGVLALGAVLFSIPSQAGAAGASRCYASTNECVAPAYHTNGYVYDPMYVLDGPPVPGADLIHVKIRNGHTHTLQLTSFRPDGSVVDDHSVEVSRGFDAWYDPSKVSNVQITLSGRSTVTANVDGYHCYYEDKHGNLQPATDRPCTPH